MFTKSHFFLSITIQFNVILMLLYDSTLIVKNFSQLYIYFFANMNNVVVWKLEV